MEFCKSKFSGNVEHSSKSIVHLLSIEFKSWLSHFCAKKNVFFIYFCSWAYVPYVSQEKKIEIASTSSVLVSFAIRLFHIIGTYYLRRLLKKNHTQVFLRMSSFIFREKTNIGAVFIPSLQKHTFHKHFKYMRQMCII